MADLCVVSCSRSGAGTHLRLLGMTSLVHIDKKVDYQSFGGMLCPHLQDGQRIFDYTEDEEINILPKYCVHFSI